MPVLAIPVVAVALIALLCVLLYFAAEEFGHILAHFIPGNLPFIGGKLRSAVDGFASSAVNGVKVYAANKIGPFADLVRMPLSAMRVHLSTILATQQSLSQVSAAIIRNIMPAYVTRVANALRADVARSIAFTRSEIARAIALGKADVAAARAYADARLYAASNALRADVARSIAFTRSEIAAVIALGKADVAAAAGALGRRIDGLTSRLERDIAATGAAVTAAETALRGELHGTEAAILHTLDQEVSAAIRTVETTVAADAARPWSVLWPDIEATVEGLEGILADDLPDIGAAIRAIGREVPIDMLGSVAASSAISLALLRYLRDCGVPNCKNLGKVGHDFQALFSAVGDGALLAFLAAAVSDPAGAASAIDDTVSPMLGDAARAFGDTIGVR